LRRISLRKLKDIWDFMRSPIITMMIKFSYLSMGMTKEIKTKQLSTLAYNNLKLSKCKRKIKNSL